jgi:hypothetical protein
MPRKSTRSYEPQDERPTRSARGFTELVREVPVEQFVRMVNRCGLPTADARELCAAFRELKQ